MKFPADSDQADALEFIPAKLLRRFVRLETRKWKSDFLPVFGCREAGTIGLPWKPQAGSSKVHIVEFVVSRYFDFNACIGRGVKMILF